MPALGMQNDYVIAPELLESDEKEQEHRESQWYVINIGWCQEKNTSIWRNFIKRSNYKGGPGNGTGVYESMGNERKVLGKYAKQFKMSSWRKEMGRGQMTKGDKIFEGETEIKWTKLHLRKCSGLVWYNVPKTTGCSIGQSYGKELYLCQGERHWPLSNEWLCPFLSCPWI